MYSVVLMLALTGSAEIPDHHGRGHGCAGYGGGYGGGCMGYGGGYGGMIYGQPYIKPMVEDIKGKGKEGKEGGEVAAPATLVVILPANAKLTVDGAATTSTTAVRTFQSP